MFRNERGGRCRGLVALVAAVPGGLVEGLPVRALAAPVGQAAGGSCQGGPAAVLGCLASPSRLAGAVAQSAGSQVMQGVTGWITDAASWFLDHVQELLVGTTGPDLRASWWVDRYRLLLAFAALVAAVTLLIAIADAAMKGSWEGLARALGVDVPVAAISGSATPVLVGYLIQVADWLSGRLLDSFGHDSVAALRNTATWFGTFGQAGGPPMPLFLGAVLALVAIVGGVLVTLELLLRANAIYLVTALIPVVYALRVWPALQPLARRTVEVLVAVIMAQPVVALAIAIGARAGANLGTPGERPSVEFGRALTGTGMLLLAALAPWAILHLLPALEAGMAAQRQRAAVSAGPRAAIQTVYVGSYLGRMTQPGLRRAAAGSTGAGGSGGQTGWQLPRTAGDAATGATSSADRNAAPHKTRGQSSKADDTRSARPQDRGASTGDRRSDRGGGGERRARPPSQRRPPRGEDGRS
jgi:hypothetical protein